MGHYIWQNRSWPDFEWNSEELLEVLGQARKAQGRVIAQATFIGLESQANLMIEEAFTTSAIEGEILDRKTIRSSVAKRLGLSVAGLPQQVRKVEGLVEMLIDATHQHACPLTAKRLQGWQAALFPTGYSGMQKILVGNWRKSSEPMQVVSGVAGHEKIHFEAPPSQAMNQEMKLFLEWWKSPPPHLDGLLRAAIAHFWFVTIHPFEDGNGRIARAITDMALAQDENTGQRLYSLSTQINRERNDYYQILEKTQKQNGDITPWLKWFLEMYARAIANSENGIKKALLIAKFWQNRSHHEMNERQLKVVQKLLEAGPEGFEGGLTNRKYVSITNATRETTKRDLADLEEKKIIKRNAGKGRSVSYSLEIFKS